MAEHEHGVTPATSPAAPGYRASIVIAAVFFVLDTFVLAQGLLAFLCIVYIVLWGLPQALFAWRRPAERNAWLIRSAAYGVAGAAMIGFMLLNRSLAEQGAEQIVAAVERFHAAERRYPKELDELAPRFLARVPRGDFRPYVTAYRYWQTDGTYLSYAVPPTYSRRMYMFEKRSWRYDD